MEVNEMRLFSIPSVLPYYENKTLTRLGFSIEKNSVKFKYKFFFSCLYQVMLQSLHYCCAKS